MADAVTTQRRVKAHLVAACCKVGVLMASVALANANLVRRWVLEADTVVDKKAVHAPTTAPKSSQFAFELYRSQQNTVKPGAPGFKSDNVWFSSFFIESRCVVADCLRSWAIRASTDFLSQILLR